MASGVAPVATRVGGIPEVITHGNDGLLIDPGDPGILAAALTKVLADDTDRARLAAAARQRAGDFDLGRAVRCIESIYEDALVR
jgi:glycosyltransferase involved in cell wall biosynthesis